MQPTKLFPGLRAAILTFQIDKLWRRFLRIVTSKDKGPFLMTPVIYFFYISHNFKRCIDIVSSTSFQRRICNVILCLFLVIWFCYTPSKEIDWLWVKNMICEVSWYITKFSTSYWRWNFVEFWRHVFNVLLTLKFWRFLDVMFSTSYWHWNSDELSMSIFQCPTDVDFWLFNVVNQIQRIQHWYNVVCLLG